MLATVLCSGLFWLLVMPRLARQQIGRGAGIVIGIAYGVLLVAIPVSAYVFLPERTLLLGGLIVIAWCLAVRASAWFTARKYFVPLLRTTALTLPAQAPAERPPAAVASSPTGSGER